MPDRHTDTPDCLRHARADLPASQRVRKEEKLYNLSSFAAYAPLPPVPRPANLSLTGRVGKGGVLERPENTFRGNKRR